MPLQAAIDDFLLQLRADGRVPATVEQYRRHLREFAVWCRHRGIESSPELSTGDVAAFVASASQEPTPNGGSRNRRTVNAVRSSVRGFCEYLERSGAVERSPARLLRSAQVPAPIPRGMSEAEVARFLAALDSDHSAAARRDRALFGFLLTTGGRLGAVLSLEVGDLDLAASVAELGPSKTTAARRVHLRDDLVVLLRAHVGSRRSGPLFVGRGDAPMTARHAHRRFAEWLDRAGIHGPYSPHSLRHTFALRLYRRTEDIALVKEALGHASITSTMVYARADDERVRLAVLAE